ncbi:MAG TPA: hypothetical protein VLL27_08870 [Solirubrobacterales bacterium]|nr:hypothetical protein [Solirubrobacterales bacterium]
MLRTDTGNFNRFLTSLGLLLLLAAVLVPYFYFHDTDTLRIPVKELNGLTDVGREALETRQRREADLEVWVLGFAAVLTISGITALWLGGRRLRVAQGRKTPPSTARPSATTSRSIGCLNLKSMRNGRSRRRPRWRKSGVSRNSPPQRHLQPSRRRPNASAPGAMSSAGRTSSGLRIACTER